eukprot:14505797-Heterocapsa_arctica.AAC.1
MGMHQRDQQGDLCCGDTVHPVTISFHIGQSFHIVNATLCLSKEGSIAGSIACRPATTRVPST